MHLFREPFDNGSLCVGRHTYYHGEPFLIYGPGNRIEIVRDEAGTPSLAPGIRPGGGTDHGGLLANGRLTPSIAAHDPGGGPAGRGKRLAVCTGVALPHRTDRAVRQRRQDVV